MKLSIQQFSVQNECSILSNSQQEEAKGGSYNILCNIYIQRQGRKGETVDSGVLEKLMGWDAGLNDAIDYFIA